MKKIVFTFIFIYTTCVCLAQGNVYVRFSAFTGTFSVPAITGPTTIGGFSNLIKVSTFTGSIENPTTLGSASGGASGKSKFNEIKITKPYDVSSVSLFFAAATGAHAATVDFVFTDAVNNILFVKSMSMVFVTLYQTDAASCSVNCPGVIETFTLVFGAQQMTNYVNGNPGLTLTWSQINNSPNP